MDLSRYLETMKNLPDRFSNLAFWRGVRKLKDVIVSVFAYINSWGNHIELEISKITKIDYTRCNRVTAFDSVKQVDFHVIEDTANDVVVIMFKPPAITISNMPNDFGALVGAEFIVDMETNNGEGSVNTVLMPAEIIKMPTGPNTFSYMLFTNSTCAVAIDKFRVRDWKKPYKATVTRGSLVYYPTV